MTAVRRLLIIVCALSASMLPAQTTTTTTAQPAPVPAEGPQSSQSAAGKVAADTDQDISNPRSMRLTLDDAIHTAIKQNLGVELQRYEYGMAGEQLRGSYGIFDPLGTAQLSRTNRKIPALSAFDASSQAATSANLGIGQNLPTGGLYSIGMTNQRFTRGGPFTTLSPGYSTGLNFGLTQPLARNFGVDVTRRSINIARNTLGVNREVFRGALLDTTNTVEQAYYDLVYARQFVDVVKEALFLARDQARITQIRIDVGASAPLDILQPRVQIATAEENLIVAVANVRAAEDRLRQLMNLPQADWDRPIVPTDNVRYTPMSVDLQQSVARAYELRPEIKENQLATDTRRIQYLFARNQVLPQFDTQLGYSVAGAAGRRIDPNTGLPLPGGETKYGSSVRQLFDRNFPGWSIGVNLGIPVFNIGARAEAKRAQLSFQQSQLTEAQTRQNIVVEVRSTVRAIDTAAKEITASGTARNAAEKNLDAERKRYENGMTTNFQVLQVQQQLSDARARELQALVGYSKAVAAYHRAVGDLLDVRSITVDEPPVQEPGIFSRFDRYNWLKYENHLPEEK